MTIVGGSSSYAQQISVVESCGLRRIGDLPSDFNGGACNTYRPYSDKDHAMLCFSASSTNGCLRYDGFGTSSARVSWVSSKPHFVTMVFGKVWRK